MQSTLSGHSCVQRVYLGNSDSFPNVFTINALNLQKSKFPDQKKIHIYDLGPWQCWHFQFKMMFCKTVYKQPTHKNLGVRIGGS